MNLIDKCSVLVVTYNQYGFPWINFLSDHNKNIDLFTTVDTRVGNKSFLWSSCDITLRDWWKQNRNKVSTSHLWFIEHDVFVNDFLPDHKNVTGMAGKDIKTNVNSKWQWFKQVHMLNGLKPVGVAPFGITLYFRGALDSLIDSKWDNLFQQNIFCELRTPSIINSCGFKIDSLHLPDIQYHPIEFDMKSIRRGIFHSVKSNQWYK